jgi:hypothetical protein
VAMLTNNEISKSAYPAPPHYVAPRFPQDVRIQLSALPKSIASTCLAKMCSRSPSGLAQYPL